MPKTNKNNSSKPRKSSQQRASNSNQAPVVRRRSRRRAVRNMYARSENGYLKTLLYPEYTPGQKIPDLCSFPTGTFQLSYDSVISTTAGDAFNFSFVPNINAPLTLQTNAVVGGPFGASINIDWPSKAAVQAAYKAYRPVSAELYIEYIGTSLNDSGYAIGYLSNRQNGNPAFAAQTVAGVLALPYTRTYPLRNGCRVVWKPEDNADFEFQDVIQNNVYPFIGVCVAGATSTTAVVKVRCLANFEGLPRSDTLDLVNASASPINLGQLQEAFQAGSNPYSSFSSFSESVGRFMPDQMPTALSLASNAIYHGMGAYSAYRASGLSLPRLQLGNTGQRILPV